MNAASERIGARAAARVAGRLADAVREELGGEAVRLEDARVVVEAAGVRHVPALRWPGGLLR